MSGTSYTVSGVSPHGTVVFQCCGLNAAGNGSVSQIKGMAGPVPLKIEKVSIYSGYEEACIVLYEDNFDDSCSGIIFFMADSMEALENSEPRQLVKMMTLIKYSMTNLSMFLQALQGAKPIISSCVYTWTQAWMAVQSSCMRIQI